MKANKFNKRAGKFTPVVRKFPAKNLQIWIVLEGKKLGYYWKHGVLGYVFTPVFKYNCSTFDNIVRRIAATPSN